MSRKPTQKTTLYIGVVIALVPLCVLALLLLATSMALPPKPKVKGVYYTDAGIISEGKSCKPDSMAGLVMRVDRDYENPLFQSKLPNRVHLLVWFKDGITVGSRIQLPSPRVEVCYWEQGDLLMFHTTKPQGWLDFSAGKLGSRLDGKLEVKLVEPDHNMSNSDYHFMGGAFSLTPSKL
jgi:hypothetical protein